MIYDYLCQITNYHFPEDNRYLKNVIKYYISLKCNNFLYE